MKHYWNNAIDYKPEINEKDEWDKEHKVSVLVLVWIEGYDSPALGKYFHESQHWSVSGFMGFDQSKLKWYQYISNPYNPSL